MKESSNRNTSSVPPLRGGKAEPRTEVDDELRLPGRKAFEGISSRTRLPVPRCVMISVFMLIFLPALPWSATSVCGQTILYVDQNATGPEHDGWTWCTAFTDLQDALDAAV